MWPSSFRSKFCNTNNFNQIPNEIKSHNLYSYEFLLSLMSALHLMCKIYVIDLYWFLLQQKDQTNK